MKTASVLFALIIASLAISCGGGSSSTSTTTTSPQSTVGLAQGVYSGSSSSGWSFSSIVLPNDTFYAIYGSQSSSAFLIYGMMTGQGASTSTAYSATVKDYYYTGTMNTANVSATYVAGTSIQGTISESGASQTFNGTSLPSSDFNYNSPASVSAIAGSWTGSSLEGSSGTLTVSSNGAISGSLSGCSVTGTVTPDSQKNFYNVSIKFGTSACLLPNQTANGIAVTYQISGTTKHQLLAGGSTSAGGTVFTAIR